MDKEDILDLVSNSLKKLYAKDQYLINQSYNNNEGTKHNSEREEHNSERSLVFHFGCYFIQELEK